MNVSMNIRIEKFKDEYADSFKTLNLEWIEEFFKIEEEDLKILSNPQEYVIDKGGEIFFAIHNELVIGTSAMVPVKKGVFELAKMAVTKPYQGKGIGRMLMESSLKFANDSHANEVFLVTNDQLLPALELYNSSGFALDTNYDDNRYERGNTKLKLKLN